MMEILKKNKKIVIVGVLVAAVVIIAVLLGSGNGDFKKHLSLGNQYLEELKYEEAVVEFMAAFRLEPKNKSAIEGIEKACLAYADSVLTEPENVEIETYVKVSEVLMGSYEATQIESIHSKVEAIEEIIQEKEEIEASEEALAEAEEEKRKEEEKKKAEEEEKKKELEEYYKWQVEEILTQNGYLYYFEVTCEETDAGYVLTALGGSSGVEKIVFTLDGKTGKTVITQHLWEDWETGEMVEMSEQHSLVGREFDFSSELYKEWLIKQEEFPNFAKESVKQTVEYINSKWEPVLESSVSYQSNTIMSNGTSPDSWYGEARALLRYLNADKTERYIFEIMLNTTKKQVEITGCTKENLEDYTSEYISLDFETTINITDAE